jgi:hypothetical protein
LPFAFARVEAKRMPFALNVSKVPGDHAGATSCSLTVGAAPFPGCANEMSEVVAMMAVNEVTAKSLRMRCRFNVIAAMSPEFGVCRATWM